MTELEALEVVRNVGVGYFVTAYKGNIQSTFCHLLWSARTACGFGRILQSQFPLEGGW